MVIATETLTSDILVEQQTKMTNIFLTKRCNLSCPYCFADEFVNKSNGEFSLDLFVDVLNFILQDSEQIGLIGGEPTIHPQFKEICDILIADDRVKDITLYTNGLLIDKYINELKNNKFGLLINCNSPENLGKNYLKLKENIKLLADIEKKEVTLGINIHKKDMDYSYIFELQELIPYSRNIRYSTSLSNSSKCSAKCAFDTFKEMKPILFSFFKDCYSKNIGVSNDCNGIPWCILNAEEKAFLLKYNILGKNLEIGDPISSTTTCSPVIDILPDLTTIRCFGLSKYLRVPISNFKNSKSIYKFFDEKFDSYARIAFLKEDCQDCKHHYLNRCGVCQTYKLSNIEKIKEYTQNLAKNTKLESDIV